MVRLTSHDLQRIVREAGLAPASVVVRTLNRDALAAGEAEPGVALDPHAPIYPASMMKVPLVATVLTAIAEGILATRKSEGDVTAESEVEVTPENMTANDGPSPLVPGYRAKLRELMHRAIARSDNVATNVLFDVIGRERATRIARERLGLSSTAFHRKLSGSEPLIDDPQWDGVHRNAHPAGDAARLFAAIERSTIAEAAWLRAALAEQVWNDKLSAGLRPGDAFAHKTGDTSQVTHDGGILRTGDGATYAVVVYTGLPSTPENNARFGPFMRSLREFL